MDALLSLLQKEGTLSRDPVVEDAATTEKNRKDLKSAVQVRFLTLLGQGLRANAAAARAILEVSGKVPQCRLPPLTLDGLHSDSDADAAAVAAPSPRCCDLLEEGFALLESPQTPKLKEDFGQLCNDIQAEL